MVQLLIVHYQYLSSQVWFQNRRSKQRKLSGHPAPQMTSVPKSLPTTHTVYPKTYIPDASMPVYFPLRSPSPVLSSGSLKSTPLSLSPPTYFSHLPFTATTLPSPTGPAVTQSSPTYLSQTQMPFQTITSPSPRFPYPRPPITEHNSCNNVSVVTLPSVFTNEVMSRQSFAVPNNRVGYYWSSIVLCDFYIAICDSIKFFKYESELLYDPVSQEIKLV